MVMFYVIAAFTALVAGSVTYALVRRDLGPRAAPVASGCIAAAACAGWILTLFHVIVGCAAGLAVYLVARRRLPGVRAVVAGGLGYVAGTLLSVGGLMIALSGM
ncbi:hypothetical protein [Streptomyces sp. ODS28]|uniref:hypothetical protein n=1 Tax=Streptomyces sp. ODS28 TaxID=3136688 RepID=UPI0031ED7C88